MQTAILVILVVVCAAIVLLFAMLGELWSRVSDMQTLRRSTAAVTTLADAPIGATDFSWPPVFGETPRLQSATFIVLSTTCGSCFDVARELGIEKRVLSLPNIRVVVSCADEEAGLDFVRRYSLTAYPHFVDAQGAWANAQLKVNTSPSAFIFESGRLSRAVRFGSMEALEESANADKRAVPGAFKKAGDGVRELIETG